VGLIRINEIRLIYLFDSWV